MKNQTNSCLIYLRFVPTELKFHNWTHSLTLISHTLLLNMGNIFSLKFYYYCKQGGGIYFELSMALIKDVIIRYGGGGLYFGSPYNELVEFIQNK